MAVSRIEILVAILLFSLGVQGGDYFDCHRKGQDCANNKACKDGGRCDCGDDYSGDDCGLTLSEKGQSPCASDTDSCGSDGGLCYNNGGSKACYCPADSYGNQCENKRYQVTCSTSSILIVLNPFGTFDGVVYVKDQKETSGCTFATADLPSGKNGLALNVADADCGSVTTDQATSDRSRVVIVQYNDKYITDLDTKLTVTCSPGGAVTIDVTKVFLADGNLKGQGINNTVDIDSSAVDFDIKLKDGTAVTSSTEVPLDDLLTFEFNGDKGPQPVPTSALRLINGSTPNVGRLQIFRNGEWGTICTSGLNSEVARVVCRQLGMESPQARFVSDHFGPVSGNMWKFRARCIYSESALERCSLSRWRQESCKKRDIGGISCPSVPKNPQLRLVNGSTDKEGRLEVFYNNQWGTICDKYFDTIAAAVACKMLGHRPVGAQMLSRDDVTDGTGPIWMSSIDCNPGSEDSLTDCEHHGWEQDQEIILNSDNCQHKNDVGIRCEGDIYSDLKIRLRNGSHEQEGRVEIFHDNQWGTMTDNFFYHLAAKVICRMLGFPTEGATPRIAGYFPAGTGPLWVDRLLCKGDETNINECQYWACDENRRASYYHNKDAGVTCGGTGWWNS
ncbi:scavenger receptor cysteine-rich domain-containing group B protein-like [Gigantopelta aegis]|uniref:scavenger receptor cysteine-rich domain-containing group B protein-like n=1 Tax=Gigantopelta aegis TaxID=1735272 RepID=UPI001B88D23E|nr:scavenger receptor cysteine-rich domain-containing group B protein-like [Gigantopelta aegis]